MEKRMITKKFLAVDFSNLFSATEKKFSQKKFQLFRFSNYFFTKPVKINFA
jgi:hypothetical protein